MRSRLVVIGLAFAVPALVVPAQAVAGAKPKPKAFTIPVPADGKVSVLSLDAKAKDGGKAPQIVVGVQYPRALRKEIGIVARTEVGGRTKRLTVYVLNPKPKATSAGLAGTGNVTVKVGGKDTEISVANVRKVRDGFGKLTKEQKDQICKPPEGRKGGSVVKELLKLQGTDGNILARAVADVICKGEKANEDRRKLVEQVLNITLPGDKPPPPKPALKIDFRCIQDANNVNEGNCTMQVTEGGPVSAARIVASGDDQFSQCFSPADACTVEGQQITYLFDAPQTSTQLFARMANQTFAGASPWTLFVRPADGNDFVQVAGFDPP